MKTKFYSLLAGIILASTSAFACHDSTKVCIGNCSDDGFKFWQGLDIGVNGYLNSKNTLTTPEGYNFLELDYARSHSFSWNMGQYNLHLYKNYINLVTGIGLEWNSYAFRQNISLATNANMVTGLNESLDFSKNKLRTTFLNAPVLFEFNTSSNPEKSVHLAIGATFGYNVFRNKMIQEFAVNGDEQKRKTKDDFNINPFRYSLTARVGYGNFTLFANYGMTTLFKANQGPKVYPVSAGVSLNF
jgi:hypothetical protein